MARRQLTIRSLLGFTTIVAVWLGLFSVFPSVAFNLSGVFLLAFLAIQFMDIQFMFWAPLTVILMAYVETYLPAMGGMPNEVFYGMLGILFCNSIAIRSIARTRKAFANANRMAGVLSTGIANSSKAGFNPRVFTGNPDDCLLGNSFSVSRFTSGLVGLSDRRCCARSNHWIPAVIHRRDYCER